MLDERLRIETPEQIDLAYDVAGIGSRFTAALIDHTVLSILAAIIVAVVAALLEKYVPDYDVQIVATIGFIGLYLLLCAYYIFFETLWNGQTPGKRLLGLRVVRSGGRPIGFLGSTTRNIIRLADFLPVVYGVGVLTMFIDRQSRRLGDLAAGALTVKEQRTLTLESLLIPTAKHTGGPVAESLTIPNLEAITADDYQLIQEYLTQRLGLSIEARRRLSSQLLQGMQTRLGYPIYGNPEAFLLRFVAEYNALHATPAQPPVLPPATA